VTLRVNSSSCFTQLDVAQRYLHRFIHWSSDYLFVITITGTEIYIIQNVFRMYAVSSDFILYIIEILSVCLSLRGSRIRF